MEASAVLLTRNLTADDIAGYRIGSIEQLVAWYSYTALIWTLKGAMLFFFYRLTYVSNDSYNDLLRRKY